MAQVARRSLLVREVCGSNLEPISHTLSTTRHDSATLEVWVLAQSGENGYRSLVTLERVLSEYNEDLIFFWLFMKSCYTHDSSEEKYKQLPVNHTMTERSN